MLLTVREKEVYGKLYSLVDQIISHRGKEGSVVKELVIERLVLKKEREERKKERKTIDFRFFSPPFIFVQVHFPKKIHQEFLTFRGSEARGNSKECVESIFRFFFS